MNRFLVAIVTGWTRRRAANVGTLVLAVANAIISYDALAAAARDAGLPWVLSWLFPLATDGIIAVATPAQLELRERNAPRRVRAQIGFLLWAAIVFSVVGNATRAPHLWSGHALYGIPMPTWNAIWLALPPLAYAGALHVLGLVHRYPLSNDEASADPAPLGEELARLRDELAQSQAALAEAERSDSTPSQPRSTRRRGSDADQGTAARRSAGEVLAMVRGARERLAGELGREPSDHDVAALVTAGGHPITASRVRSYLAQLRAEEREQPAGPQSEQEVVAWHAS